MNVLIDDMDNTRSIPELCALYVAGEISSEEQEYVEEWIRASPANEKFFRELCAAWRLAGVVGQAMDIDDEWGRFRKANQNAWDQPIGDPAPVYLVQGEAVIQRPGNRRKIIAAAGAAAAVTGVLLLSTIFFRQEQSWNVAKQEMAGEEMVSPATLFTRANLSTSEQRVCLPDSSLAIIFKGSSIQYTEGFRGTERRILLDGRALFEVAKDTTKPFIVQAGNILVRAVGTRFSVSTGGQGKCVKVKLYEGKVLVSHLAKEINMSVGLVPGDELLYDADADRLLKRRAAVARHTAAKYPPLRPAAATGQSGAQFNNESLSKVFDRLAFLYTDRIRYDRGDVAGKYFIGQFSGTESLEQVLKKIAIANDLIIYKEADTWIISKEKRP